MQKSISEKAKVFSDEAYKYLVVNKLIDTIKKLENSPQSETRWIWELFQNGKDCVKADSKIKLKITISNDSLAFEHNGRPFKIRDLVYLIDQTSSKSRKSTHLTGNYGTGFITTHLLSKIVHISGILKSDKNDYRRFELELLRNSDDQKIMIENLDIALETFEILEKTSPIKDFNKENYNTKFKYKLDQKGLDIALKGLEDLDESIFLVLLFNKNIEYVSVSNKIKNEKIYYKIKEEIDNLYTLNKKITDKNTNNKQSLNSEFLLYGVKDLDNEDEKENENEIKNNVEIAFNVTNHFIVEKNKKAPVLFIDFPLIGSEEFPFPCYINSHNFKLTNDDRSHIILSGESRDTLINIQLLNTAAELLINFIDKATKKGDFENKHLLAKSFIPNNVNININLYKKEIQYCIREKLGKSRIIKNIDNKYIKLNECIIPEITDILPQNEQQKNELIIKLHNIIALIFRKSLIYLDINYINYWLKTIDDDWINEFRIKNRFTLEDLIFFIESKHNLNELKNDLDFRDDSQVINWLNQVYEFLYDSTSHKKANELLNDHNLIPNQKNELKKGSELYEDNDIPEIIKDLLFDFDVDIRKDLKNINIIHNLEKDCDISQAKKIIISYFQDKTININKLIEYSFKIISIINELNENEKILKLMFLNIMNIFFKRKNASILIKENNETVDSLSIIAENFLIESIIVPQIEELKNLNEFINFFGQNYSQEDIIIWLNNFYFILENKTKIKIMQEKSIFPNQIGEFKKGKELTKDNIYFEEYNEDNEFVILKLKKLYAKIEKKNLFAELLDNRIKFENFFVISKEIKLKQISEIIEVYFKSQRNSISTNLILKKKIKKLDFLLEKLTKNQRQMHFYWFENNKCSLLIDTIDSNSKEIILNLIRNNGQNLRLLLEQQNEN